MASSPDLSQTRLNDTADTPVNDNNNPEGQTPAPDGLGPGSAETAPVPTAGPAANERRCFVCLVDESEASLPADWSTPCTCSLEGHQECLLAWVNDLEAQDKDVKCPVCKSPITVAERYDPVIRFNNVLHRSFSIWSPRILLGFLAAGSIVSSATYGAHAISWFAGPDVTLAFLERVNRSPAPSLFRRAPVPTRDWLHFGLLPLIGPWLIINRLTVGDIVGIPFSLMYLTIHNQSVNLLDWPPRPEYVVAFYPLLKSAYFHIHRSLSESLEKTWAARAQAVAIEQGSHTTYVSDAPDHEPDAQAEPARAPIVPFLDFDIDIQIDEVDDNDPAQNGQNRANRAVDASNRSNPINFIAGALVFPGVCYGVGELMRLALPNRLVTRPSWGGPTGLLQQRWGRSFIGGCLFVVLKDAFFLYIKYKKTMNRPYRRVKNSEQRNVRA
ncbi:hypothetical protein GGR57DRAFT_428740 [Xylariaceae sp. FL1272]|nr:hypothetical protein GGR57DRAFT_428740 [Xylariaceae sp. FL1272]